MKLEPREERLLQGILNTTCETSRRPQQPPSAIVRMLSGLLVIISLALGVPRAINVWSNLQWPEWSEILPAVALMVTGGTALFLYLALRTQSAVQKRDEQICDRENLIRKLVAGQMEFETRSKKAA